MSRFKIEDRVDSKEEEENRTEEEEEKKEGVRSAEIWKRNKFTRKRQM